MNIIENVCSDIYLFILVFLLEKKPFCKATIDDYEKRRNSFLKLTPSPLNSTSGNKKLLASPTIYSKFSPSLTISKSPQMKIPSHFELESKADNDSKNLLNKLSGANVRGDKKSVTVKVTETSPSKLIIKQIPVSRKLRNNLKDIESKSTSKTTKKTPIGNIQIMPAFKQTTGKAVSNNGDDMVVDSDYSITPLEDQFSNINLDNEPVKHQGFLYKLTESKQLKKLWFTLLHRDFYCNSYI